MVRIPRSEGPTVPFRAADMPVSTGGGYAAPGQALSQLGNAIKGLGQDLASEADHQGDFEAKMIATDYKHETDMISINSKNTYSGSSEGYVGHVVPQLDAARARANERYAALSPKLQQRYAPIIQGDYNGHVQGAAREAYARRDNERIVWTVNSIEAHAQRVSAADIDTPSEQNPGRTKLDDHLAAVQMMIEHPGVPIPEAKKAQLRQVAAKHTLAAIEKSNKDNGGSTSDLYVRARSYTDNWQKEQGALHDAAQKGAPKSSEAPTDAAQKTSTAPQLQGAPTRVSSGTSTEKPAHQPDAPKPSGPLQFKPLPNGVTGRAAGTMQGGKPAGITLHHTSTRSLESAINTNQEKGTGYNYLVDRDGTIYQVAPDENYTAHMQSPGKPGRRNGNFEHLSSDNTLSISAVANNDKDITAEQRDAIRNFVVEKAGLYGIPKDNIIGHGDVQHGALGRFGREKDEGSMAAEFRDGRLALNGGPELKSGPVRVADASGRAVYTKTSDGSVRAGMPTVQSEFADMVYNSLPGMQAAAAGELKGTITQYDQMSKSGKSPAPEEIKRLEERVKAYGDPGIAALFVDTFGYAALTEQAQRSHPLAVDAQIKEIMGRIGAGDQHTHPAEWKKLKHLESIAVHMRKEINDDVTTFANNVGVQKIVPFTPDKLDDADWWAGRIQAGVAVGEKYMQPPKFLTKGEIEHFSDQIKKGGKQSTVWIGAIVKGAGPHSVSILRDVAKDKPEAAQLGYLMFRGGEQSFIQDMTNAFEMKEVQKKEGGKNHGYAPTKGDTDIPWSQAVGDAFSDPLNTGAGQKNAAAVRAAADLVYEYRHMRGGFKIFNPDVYKKTVEEAIGQREHNNETYGGMVNQNYGMFGLNWSLTGGSNYIPLPPHINKNLYRKMIDEATPEQLIASGSGLPVGANGQPVPLNKFKQGIFVHVGDGKYAVKTETDGHYLLRQPREGERLPEGGEAISVNGIPASKESAAVTGLWLYDFYAMTAQQRSEMPPNMYIGGPTKESWIAEQARKTPVQPQLPSAQTAPKPQTPKNVLPLEPVPVPDKGNPASDINLPLTQGGGGDETGGGGVDEPEPAPTRAKGENVIPKADEPKRKKKRGANTIPNEGPA
jgi:hypothetical protein